MKQAAKRNEEAVHCIGEFNQTQTPSYNRYRVGSLNHCALLEQDHLGSRVHGSVELVQRVSFLLLKGRIGDAAVRVANAGTQLAYHAHLNREKPKKLKNQVRKRKATE
ncbi:hypothetical protein E2C01_023496 [Portunus trituberculatus]|uniref:Uncharacterized protein n=1 Tax=Portunus trituberculatus TaxID=210409 RepID=A0A5B7EAP6_PORTR|nr:hypothetical protein [Portunus trituberculatus]